MMPLSRRVSKLKASPTVALNAKAKELAAQGVRVCNFSVGEPDFPTPQPIIDQAIRSLEAGRTKYGAPGGGLELRQAICDKLLRDNELSYTPDEVVVGTGAKEILFHLAMALLDEGDEVLLPAPYWVSYSAHAELNDAKAVVVPMPELSEPLRIDPALLEKHASAKTKAIMLNSPNNPAGYVLHEHELQNEYMTFGDKHVSLLQMFPNLRERFVLVNGLSKGFAMTGWRVGYCCAPLALAKSMRGIQSQSSTCLPGFIEDAATFALGSGLPLMKPAIEQLRALRDLAAELLSSIDGLTFGKPEGAFYIFIDLREALASSSKFENLDSFAFSQYLLENYQVAMVPGEDFGVPGFLRLSYATSADNLRFGISQLKAAVASL